MNRIIAIGAFTLLLGSQLQARQDQKSDDDKYKKAAKGIHLPDKSELDSWSSKGEKFKAITDWLQKEDNWVSVLKQVEERTGLFSEDLNIKVTLSSSGQSFYTGRGAGEGGKGTLLLYPSGPLSWGERYLRGTVVHEVFHIFTGGYAFGPDWVIEGMGHFTADEGNGVSSLKGAPKPIEAKVSQKESYGRGWLFFEYIRQVHSMDAIKAFVKARLEKSDIKAAFEKATSKKWDELSKEEFEWTKANWKKVTQDALQRTKERYGSGKQQ